MVEAKDWNWDSLVVVVVVEQLKAARPSRWSWRQLVGAQQHRPLSAAAAAELRSIQQGSRIKGNPGAVQVVNRGHQEARCGIDTDKKVGPAAMSVKPLPMSNIKQYQSNH